MIFAAKAAAVWLVMVVAAVLNGFARDNLLSPLIGDNMALPVSGISLSLLILIIAWIAAPLLGAARVSSYILVGILWVLLTLMFEYTFGHYVAGESWAQINQMFNLRDGNFFILVLLTALLAPLISAKLRELI